MKPWVTGGNAFSHIYIVWKTGHSFIVGALVLAYRAVVRLVPKMVDMNFDNVRVRARLFALCTFIAGFAPTTGNAAADEIRSVEIVRDGQRLSQPSNLLKKGDRIETDSESTAIVRYANGTVVYLRPNSRVRVGSIFVEIGEIFVKVKGLFRVDTEFVAAGAEGTEYAVRVLPQNEVSVVVLEGKVSCISRLRRWPKFVLSEQQTARFPGWGFAARSLASGAEIEHIRRWVNDIERAGSPPR